MVPGLSLSRSAVNAYYSGDIMLIDGLIQSDFYDTELGLSSDQKIQLRALRPSGIAKKVVQEVSDEMIEQQIGSVLDGVQIAALRNEKAWRQAEVYGIVAAVLYGELGRKLALTKEQRDSLLDRATVISAKLESALEHERAYLLQRCEEALKDTPAKQAVNKIFGPESARTVYWSTNRSD